MEQDYWAAKLLRLLAVVLSTTISVEEKERIMKEEYDIHVSKEMDEALTNMSGLGQALIEQGVELGVKKVAVNLIKMKMSVSVIVEATELTIEQLQKIAEENQLELVME